jgi:GNAT superfamily N-acetyltransferase
LSLHVVREAVVADAADVVALRSVVYPYLLRGMASTARLIADPPPDRAWKGFVAEVDGRLVGWVSASRNTAGTSSPSIQVGEVSLLHVHPDARNRGIGTQLLGVATSHLVSLNVAQLRAWVREPSVSFARSRGYEPSRSAQWAAMSLPTSDAGICDEPSQGVGLVAFSDLDARAVYAAYVAAGVDEPSDVPIAPKSFEAWSYDVWCNPDIDHSVSVACVEKGVVVAFTIVLREGDRVWSDMTATLRSHRGRGLALLVKTAALQRAAAAGATRAFTGMDSSNTAMLAVNSRLGYQPVDTQWSCIRTL